MANLNRINEKYIAWLYATTIFLSAFSLFLVQPLIAKQILPWFGGTAAVWSICMVFFQVTLLAGYAYSDRLVTLFKPKHQLLIHIALLIISLLFLPIIASAEWKPTGSEDPSYLILGMLLVTIGLPYFMLSTTGPLIQSWVSKIKVNESVYRLFSLSNLASLISLICYPFIIEPNFSINNQAYLWSVGYIFFVVLCICSGVYYLKKMKGEDGIGKVEKNSPSVHETISFERHLIWLTLPALASWLLVAVTNHITQNVASIPFLWILPLSLYLLTFVLCFESNRWYRRSIFLPITALFIMLCSYGLHDSDVGLEIKVAIPVYAIGMFLMCMVLHGELAILKPSTFYLTRFYLMLSIGGALGGGFVALVAPKIFPAYYELGLSFILIGLLLAYLFKKEFTKSLASLALALFSTVFLGIQIVDDLSSARIVQRNFYGTLNTVDVYDPELKDVTRQIYHGSIKHGEQYLGDHLSKEPTSYYGRSSGVGIAIEATRNPNHRVGVIGLGAGTLAVYGQKGDLYRMYEINPAIISVANTEFSYLSNSRAKIDLILGDARLMLEKEKPQSFDLLVIDAFSGDSVPAHLLTIEAMNVYLRHMNESGIIAYHVTNRFLDLPPLIKELAKHLDLHSVLISDKNDNPLLRDTDWVLVSRSINLLNQESIRNRTTDIKNVKGLQPWSDNFNNLFTILK